MALTQRKQPVPSPSYVIKDNVTAFIKYYVASLLFTRQIEQTEQTSKQINFWIIPQCAVSGKKGRVLGLNEILNDNYSDVFDGLGKVMDNKQMKRKIVKENLLQHLNDMDDVMDDDWKFEQDLLELNSSCIHNEIIVDCKDIFVYYYSHSHLTDLLNDDNDDSKFVAEPIWDLQSYSKKICFVENINYWHQWAKNNDHELNHQFYEMYNFANKNCNGYHHYLFVIDRRNPENVKRKNMHSKQPNYQKTSQNWRDNIYLFVGDKIMIHKDYKQKPKLSNAYFTNNLFPGNDSIKLNDELNGYKFILSYHFSAHCISDQYWYVDGASKKVEFKDMKDLWNQYFVRINGAKQELNEEETNK